MQNWKVSLDRYLTTEPDDGFSSWCEYVGNYFTDDFYSKNGDWVEQYDGLCNRWLNKLFMNGVYHEKAAQTIERAFKLFKIHNQ